MGRDDLTEQLRDFRDRFPFDDRAADFLEKVDREVLRTVLAEFKPRREGDGDYSPLVTNFARKVQGRISRQWRERKQEMRRQSSSSDRRRTRTRHRYDSESSEDSFGRTRKSVPRRRCAPSSSEARREGKASSDDESPAEQESLEELLAAVQRAQEEVNRVEKDAREEERLKVRMAEDAMARDLEEKLQSAREGFQRDMEEQLKEIKRRLLAEVDQKVEEEKQNQEEASRVRKMESEREARQERDRRIEEAEKALRHKRKQVLMAQKKIDLDHQKAIAKAKQGVSSSEEPQKAAQRKAKAKDKEKEAPPNVEKKGRAESEESSLDYRRSRREKEMRPERVNGRYERERRGRCSSRSEESSQRNREVKLSENYRSGRSRSRSKNGRTDREGPTQRELDDFRDRYPIDNRAYGVLTSVPGEVQKSVLNQFRPKREGESDYSALVASFVRAVMHRHSQAQLQPRAANSLADFRARYPMDDRAFAVLERTSSGVQNTVLADFRPRREGESDYSALVMGFIRSIEARTGMDRGRGGRGGGYRRDDDGSRSRSSDGFDDRRR